MNLINFSSQKAILYYVGVKEEKKINSKFKFKMGSKVKNYKVWGRKIEF